MSSTHHPSPRVHLLGHGQDTSQTSSSGRDQPPHWSACCQTHSPIPPSQILALILVRRLLDFVFSQHDLAWIDNIIPEKEKKKEDDKKKKKKGNKGDSSSDEEVCS